MTKTTTHYSSQLNEDFLNELQVKLHVSKNLYNLPLGSLFQMAARKNPKRNFLFVSKLLGKHIPVPPQIPIINGLLLADLFLKTFEGVSPYDSDIIAKSIYDYAYIEKSMNELHNNKVELSKNTLFLGFAETATGLGHALFHPFSKNAEYLHTTRENILSLNSSFNFEEEHSHATSHLCFALEPNYFNKFDRIVLVDDEVTTGNTALNLITALNQYYPNKEYVVVSILDWRNENELLNFKKAEQDLGIKITSLSLVEGNIEYTNTPLSFKEEKTISNFNHKINVDNVELPLNADSKFEFETKNEECKVQNKLYYKLTGRFGMNVEQNQKLEKESARFANIIKNKRQYKNTVCIGCGEFIFVPALISSKIGNNVVYHSSTRSPIFSMDKEGYPINNAIPYKNPEDFSVMNFIYNIIPGKFEEVFLFFERDINQETKDLLSYEMQVRGVSSLHFVYFV